MKIGHSSALSKIRTPRRVFFGLWLIPMGYVVVQHKVMPAALGWGLMGGGIAYIISTYLTQVAPDAPAAIEALLITIATVGEFWMVGYLLILGIRNADSGSASRP